MATRVRTAPRRRTHSVLRGENISILMENTLEPREPSVPATPPTSPVSPRFANSRNSIANSPQAFVFPQSQQCAVLPLTSISEKALPAAPFPVYKPKVLPPRKHDLVYSRHKIMVGDTFPAQPSKLAQYTEHAALIMLIVLCGYAGFLLNRYGSLMSPSDTVSYTTSIWAYLVRTFKIHTPTFRDSLNLSENYIITPQYGSFAHVTMALYHFTYLGHVLRRTPIFQPYVATIAGETPTSPRVTISIPMSQIYDLTRFHYQLNVSSIEWDDLKSQTLDQIEPLGCWTANIPREEMMDRAEIMKFTGLDPTFYPVVLGDSSKYRGAEELRMAYSFLSMFDADKKSQRELITKAHAMNIAFPPYAKPSAPEDHVFCVDHSLFHTHHLTRAKQLESSSFLDQYEHIAFTNHGTHLYFSSEIDQFAKTIIEILLGSANEPFIGVHFSKHSPCFERMGKASDCFKQLKEYEHSAQTMKALVALMEPRYTSQNTNHGSDPNKPKSIQKRANTRRGRRQPSEIKIIATTDISDLEFHQQLTGLGWLFLVSEDIDEVYGKWPREIVESAVMSRAYGYVGTGDCSTSILNALRVKAWNRGYVELF